MHEFAVEHGGYERYELRHWGTDGRGRFTGIFRIVGPRTPYERQLEAVATMDRYAISEGTGEAFAVYVLEDQTETDERLSAAFSQGTLVALPPVSYNMDRTIGVHVVGTADHVRAAVETTPESFDVTVDHVGQYDADRLPGGATLTARQREAVAAAVEIGYYAPTREGTVAAVADRLGCATSTAAEHLRKAEAAVMETVVR
jgi:predicted DNA binding protein